MTPTASSYGARMIPKAAIAVFLLFCLTGCRERADVPRSHPAPARVSLDRDRVEKSALKERWDEVAGYLGSLDASGLAPDEQAYLHYWMGASRYFRGDRAGARQSWERALECGPAPDMRSRIEACIATAREVAPARPAFSLLPSEAPKSRAEASRPAPQPDGKWMLHLGTYNVKKYADDVFRELCWKGVDVKVSALSRQGEKSWVLWMGPFSPELAEKKRLETRRMGYPALIRPFETL